MPKKLYSTGKGPYNHIDHCGQEHQDRNAVDPMHELKVQVGRSIGISFLKNIDVSEDFLDNFHTLATDKLAIGLKVRKIWEDVVDTGCWMLDAGCLFLYLQYPVSSIQLSRL